MLVYQCEDSLESIFTAIYNSYEEKRDPLDTMLCLDGELYLFAEYASVQPDPVKTEKVIRTLRRKFGEEDFESVCFALAAPDQGKAQAVYRTIAAGLSEGCARGHLFDNLADEHVHKAFALARNAGREYQHFQGFVRFAELESRILYARIRPKNHLLPFLMHHFSDRFSGENFVLQDVGRGLFGVHPSGKAWYLVQDDEFSAENKFFPENRGFSENKIFSENGLFSENELFSENGRSVTEEPASVSAQEAVYQALFRHFFRTVTIEERGNPKLQQNMLPLRFREYMTEFR